MSNLINGIKKAISPKSYTTTKQDQSKQDKLASSKAMKASRNSKKSAVKESNVDSSGNENTGFCLGCNNDIMCGMIECGRCQSWFCIGCAMMLGEDMSVINKYPYLHWYGTDCELTVTAAVDTSKSLMGKNNSYHSCRDIKNVILCIKGFVDDLEKKVLASKEAIAKQTTNAINGQIKTLYIDLVECKHREIRKNNIMFGVPESSTEEDEVKAKEILQEVSDKDINIVSIARIRPKNRVKPFPLRVTLKEEKDKWKVISKSSSLAQTTGYMKRVYIKRGLTRREREEDQP